MENPVSKVRISVGNKEEELRNLAIQIAECFQSAALFSDDADEFLRRSRIDEDKARELELLKVQVEERRELRKRQSAGEQISIKKRRMDPLDTYDPQALQDQINRHRFQANEFRSMSIRAAEKAAKAREDADNAQRKIREVRNRKDQVFNV